MSLFTTKFFKVLGIVFCWVSLAQAQTENSPFSRYGIGDLLPSQNILTRAMGGISSAYQDVQTVNFVNPASYARLKVVTLDFGIEINSRTLRTVNPPRKFSNASPGISYVQLGIPLSQKKNWGMNIGLRPISRIGYKIERRERLVGIDSAYTLFEGNGGAYEVFGGTGFAIGKLNIGVNAGYLFGSKDYSSRRTFIPDSIDAQYYRSNHQTRSNYGGLFLNAGIQYSIKLGKLTSLRLGARGNLKQDMNATKNIIVETFNSDISGATQRIDSVYEQNEIKGKLIYPASYGFGFIIDKSPRWLIGVDYSSSSWSDYRFFEEMDNVQDSWKMSIGGQVIPAAGKSYWSHVAYRAGFNIGKDYVNVQKELPVFSFTLGAGLPMRRGAYSNQSSIINTTFEFGQRGNKENPIRENFFRFGVGLSLSDVWFYKRKYE